MDDNQPVARQAEVQVWDEHSDLPETLCGTWGVADWGDRDHDLCYIVWLESGQELHLWLKGVPDQREADTDREPRSLVVQ